MPSFIVGGNNGNTMPRDWINTTQAATPERQKEQIEMYWDIVPTTYYINEEMVNLSTGQSRIFLRICCVWQPAEKEHGWFTISGKNLHKRLPPINPDNNILCLNELFFKNPNHEMIYANNFGWIYNFIKLYRHDPSGEISLTDQIYTIQWIDYAFRIASDFLSEPIIGLHLWQCIDLLVKEARVYNQSYLRAYNA